jgi:hypothetical protein
MKKYLLAASVIAATSVLSSSPVRAEVSPDQLEFDMIYQNDLRWLEDQRREMQEESRENAARYRHQQMMDRLDALQRQLDDR